MTSATARSDLASLRTPVAVPVNHLLRQASWARDRLKPFSGKTARFDCGPFQVALTILANGEVEDTITADAPAAAFTLTPGLALRMLAADPNAWREVRVNGDAGFAQEIFYVVQHLRWDMAEDLSRIFGDIAAQRMVGIGKSLQQWGKQMGDNLARSFAEYWTEEQPLIANRADLERFHRDVDRLRDDVARMEKRVEQWALRNSAKK
jgi:ubiquinone biosynthesis protein UbiJ